MITISAIASSNWVTFKESPTSDIETYTARVSRRSTLDGGSIITHSGYTHTDRDITINASMTLEQWEDLKAIHQGETQVKLSMADGLYTAMLRRIQNKNGEVTIDLYILEQIV